MHKRHADAAVYLKFLMADIQVDCKNLASRLQNLFHAQLSCAQNFIVLINVKMPTRLKARHFFICRNFSFNEQLIFRAHLS